MSVLAYPLSKRHMPPRTKEIIGGKVVMMAPARVAHQDAEVNLVEIFRRYLRGKRCKILTNAYLHLTDEDKFVPDIMIVCNRKIIKPNGVFGAPDLVVEILSRSSMSSDRNDKKAVYEKCGVKEYWIVTAEARTIEVYLLTDGKYRLDNTYAAIDEIDKEFMTEEEIENIVHEFKTSIFDDLIIKIEEVFEDMDY
ncbi:MAG: Uma2 family endonuclease [Clostridiales bacterium]|jgi:Uma2 family endonuclease|nr:Uma2 family endonuclease [Clostridiales bacterium]